ncbi:hypothetical protein GCM10009039_14880 [Halocalculus aciditolerans]|uniref:Uncharacterized protein n=2 Tax=Halocalculus aciditolerans TaxID=1383812 RepID=A0A830F302_9EURY|nr:hypothetical protein GCM10009039_14880 [Halocalculus aciditolerans]
MNQSADPEYILSTTAEEVSWNSVERQRLENLPNFSDEPQKPERSPLLIIEQILYAAKDRGDEITLRQSIFYMQSAVVSLIDQSGGSIGSTSTIFGYWKRCVEVGLQGEKERISLTGKLHVRLLSALILVDEDELIRERLRELEEIQRTAFDTGYNEPQLLDAHNDLLKKSLTEGEGDKVELILSSLLSVGSSLITEDGDRTDGSSISGESRDLIASCLSNSIAALGLIATHRESDTALLRRTTQNNVKGIQGVLKKLEEKIGNSNSEDGSAQGVKRNILSEVRESLLKSIETIYPIDQTVCQKLVGISIEIAIFQKHSHNQFLTELPDDVVDDDGFQDMIDAIANDAQSGHYIVTLDSCTDVTELEVSKFVVKLKTATKP